MDSGPLNLFIKMVKEDYKLSDEELQVLSNRLMADDREFERVWKFYKAKARRTQSGVDPFRPILLELLS